MAFDAEYGLGEDGKVRRPFHEAGCLYDIANGQRILLPTMNAESALLALEIKKLTLPVQRDSASDAPPVEHGRAGAKGIQCQRRGERRCERVRRAMLEDGEVLGAGEPQIDPGAFAAWIEEREAGALHPQPCIHERLRQPAIRRGTKAEKVPVSSAISRR